MGEQNEWENKVQNKTQNKSSPWACCKELSGAAPDAWFKGSDQAPGKKGLPKDAGMLAWIHAALRLISTSTTMVAR